MQPSWLDITTVEPEGREQLPAGLTVFGQRQGREVKRGEFVRSIEVLVGADEETALPAAPAAVTFVIAHAAEVVLPPYSSVRAQFWQGYPAVRAVGGILLVLQAGIPPA